MANILRSVFTSVCTSRLCLFILLQLAFFSAISQVQTHVVGDSVRIHSNNGKGELILQNATDSVKGFLYNKGEGRTEFRKGLIKINDSTYLVGADTLRISFSGAAGSMGLQQVTLVGDSTTNRIVVRKLITDTIYTHYRQLWLDSVPVKLIKPNYSYPATGVYDIIAIGDSALAKNTVSLNLAIGTKTLKETTTGKYNTALGLYAARDNVSGGSNTAIGYGALRSGVGSSNVGIGVSAGVYQKSGNGNTAIGTGAMFGLSSGLGTGSSAANVAVGYNALSSSSTGNNNVVLGYLGLSNDSSGSNNVIVGCQAGGLNSTGSNNICIGYQAGRQQGDYSNKLYISSFQTSTPLIGGDFSTASLTFNGSVTTTGKQSFTSTITPAGTTGAVTINNPSGTVNIQAGGNSVTVTNNLVTTTSIVMAVIRTNDSTAVVKNVVPANGSFTINLTAAATAETSLGFIVYN